MRELHLKRCDFEVEWFSGSGGGGQHRNKHDNCCRIRHIATGLSAIGTANRERIANRRDAFQVLAARILDHYRKADAPVRRTTDEVVRIYHGARNEVIDKASGIRDTFKRVVVDAEPGVVIEARRNAILQREMTDAKSEQLSNVRLQKRHG